MCPHTTIYMSSYHYMCHHTTICVRILLYMCPHASTSAAVPVGLGCERAHRPPYATGARYRERERLTLRLYVLHWYKYTNADTSRSCVPGEVAVDSAQVNPKFPCFTSTKVQNPTLTRLPTQRGWQLIGAMQQILAVGIQACRQWLQVLSLRALLVHKYTF
jgi:hypothetical protein